MENFDTRVRAFCDSIRSNDSRIAIIGDICLDRYCFLDGKVSEISIETGLETRSVRRVSENLGGAGNVAVNLKHLSVRHVDLYGVLGDDADGRTIQRLMRRERIGDKTVVQKQKWHSNVYQKMVKNNQELNRYDFGNFNRISDATIDALIQSLEKNITSYGIVIINEQLLAGLHSAHFVSVMQRIIDSHKEIDFIVDTRNYLGKYKNVIYKININEAERLAGTKGSPLELGRRIYLRFNKSLIITLGKEGCLTIDEGKPYFSFGLESDRPSDAVGAGDAFLAGVAAAKIAGFPLTESTEIGNLNASISILTLYGCGHPTLKDLMAGSGRFKWRYNGWRVKSPERIRFADTSIELLDTSITSRLPLPKIAIFDHDGTISVLRQGWEKVMSDTLVGALSQACGSDPAKKERIKDEIAKLIDKTTGIQTITQMCQFRDLVRAKRWLREEDILSPEEYKKIYLDNLKTTMRRKLDAVKTGLLSPDDLTIKGAVDFLRELKSNGVALYLASGTDRADVIAEAELLGYRNLFGENIYGSVGNARKDPKETAIEDIVRTIGVERHNKEDTMVFGDGPVEMRIAVENGFRAIGVLSDEKQRFGINEAKRPRLILAGAEALIPDFSEIGFLIGQQ